MDTMSSNTICIDEEFTKTIKEKRCEKNFTQSDVAKILGINVKKYSRIETLSQTAIEKDLYEKLLTMFDIDDVEMKDMKMSRITITIPLEWRKDLERIQEAKGYSSLNETIKRCLEDVMYLHNMSKVETTLREDIRDLLSNTYHKEMEKIALRLSVNEILLKKLLEESDYDYEDIMQSSENLILKILRANKY